MEMSKTQISIIVAMVMTCLISITVYALLTTSQTIPNSGTVKTIGVSIYSDSNCTQKVTQIPWGPLEPGQKINKTVYVRNEGGVNLVIRMTTNSWTPSTSYITLTWNKEGNSLAKGNTVQATFTLSVASNVTGVTDFTFNIVITGTES
jgi:hypothetical protein